MKAKYDYKFVRLGGRFIGVFKKYNKSIQIFIVIIILLFLFSQILFQDFKSTDSTDQLGPNISEISNEQLTRTSIVIPNQTRNETNYSLELLSGWASPPDYVPEPEPIKTIAISTESLNQITFNFTLFNHGDNATIGFSIDVPTNWSASSLSDHYYPANSNSTGENLSITITLSTNRGDISVYSEPIELTAFVTASPEYNSTISFRIKIEHWPYPIFLTKPEPIISPPVGIFNITVVNDGNGHDNFEMSVFLGADAVEQEELELAGWEIEIYSGKITRILRRGEGYLIDLQLSIPPSIPSTTKISLRLFAKSIYDPNHIDSEKSIILNATVGVYKSIQLSIDDPSIELSGDQIIKNITLLNIGNAIDPDIDVFVSKQPFNWTIILDKKEIPQAGLGSDQSVKIMITITKPSFTIANSYFINLTSRSYRSYPEGDYFEYNLTLEIIVPRRSALKVELLNSIPQALPGDKIQYSIRVHNLGNHWDRVGIDHEVINGHKSYFDLQYVQAFSLEAFTFRELQINFTVDNTIQADPERSTEIKENYSIKIIAFYFIYSDISAQNITEIEILPISDFSIRKAYDIQIIRYPDLVEDDEKVVNFKVFNYGNYHDSIQLELTGPSWVQLEKQIIDIPYREREESELNLIMNFTSRPEVGNYNITISAWSLNNISVIDSVQFSIIIADYDLSISSLKLNDNTNTEIVVEPDEIHIIEVTLKNYHSSNFIEYGTEVVEVNVSIVDDRGQVEELINYTVLDISETITDVFEFYWRANTTGEFTLYASARLIGGTNEDETNFNNNRNHLQVIVDSSEKFDQTSGAVGALGLGSFVIYWIIILITVLILIILLLYIDITKYKIARGLSKLSSSLANGAQPNTRDRMIRYIIDNPGIFFTAIKNNLNLKTTATAYQLDVLQQQKLIFAKRDGVQIRFYPKESITVKSQTILRSK